MTQVYVAVIVLIGWVLAQEVAGRLTAVQDRDSAGLQRELADARRMAAELGVVLADAGTMRQVAERVSAAVHAQVGAAYAEVSILAADGHGFARLAAEGTVPPLASAPPPTVESDAPGPQAFRDRTPVYLADRAAPAPGAVDARPGSDGGGGAPGAALPLLTEAGPSGTSRYGGRGRMRRPRSNASIWVHRGNHEPGPGAGPAPGGRAARAGAGGDTSEVTRLLAGR